MLGYRGNKGFYLGSLSWDISLSWGIDVRRVSLLGYKDVYVYIYSYNTYRGPSWVIGRKGLGACL